MWRFFSRSRFAYISTERLIISRARVRIYMTDLNNNNSWRRQIVVSRNDGVDTGAVGEIDTAY